MPSPGSRKEDLVQVAGVGTEFRLYILRWRVLRTSRRRNPVGNWRQGSRGQGRIEGQKERFGV